MKQNLIKQDITFLEYPLWFQDKNNASLMKDGYVWCDRQNFIYRSSYKPPVKMDSIFLSFLLLESQNEGWKERILTSRFKILKSCGIDISKKKYQRLEDSLKRWTSVVVEFEGTFYDGKNYQTMQFHIIDDWGLEKETGKLWINFSSKWLDRIKNSNYFKHIDFEEFKQLHSPLATRLYEILIKSFQTRNLWEIGAKKLAKKIPMKEKYPSDIIPKIKTAIKRINKHTSLQISLEVKKPQRGKAIFTFRKQGKVEKVAITEGKNSSIREKLEELLLLIPEKERKKKSVEKMLLENIEKHDENYVIRNIIHTNRNAKKSYPGYLWKSLEEDYGKDLEIEIVKEEEPQEEKLRLPSLSEVLNVPEDKEWDFEELVELVPEDYQDDTRIFKIISLALEKKTVEEVIWDILYTNDNPYLNYVHFLHAAIQNNFGKNHQEYLAREIAKKK